MKTHDRGKPFQCSTCNRGYVTAAALTAHMQGHKVQNQLAKRLKHFAKYQANCLPGLVPMDLIKSIVTCSQQIQTQTASSNQLPNNGLINSLVPNSTSSAYLAPSSTNSILPANLNVVNGSPVASLPPPQPPSNLLQPMVNPLNTIMNSNGGALLQQTNLVNNNVNINLNSQLHINLIQPPIDNRHLKNNLKENSINQPMITSSDSPSPVHSNVSANKRSIVELSAEDPSSKRMRTSSISEKDENSCSSSFNSVNDQSLDEEEVDVTSFEEEERSNSVNSLMSNSLSSSANSAEHCDLTNDRSPTSKSADQANAKKTGTNDKAKKYSCRFCSSNFDYKRSCDRHEKSIHTGERRFQCPECPNRYSRSDHLKSHLRTHENQRRNGKLRRRTIQTFLSNQQQQSKSASVTKCNQTNSSSKALIETTSTVNSEQNSLLCNVQTDQKSSANKDAKTAVEKEVVCRSPDLYQTSTTTIALNKPNGVSNYNIETLLAETAKLKRNSERFDYPNDQPQLTQQLYQQSFLNNNNNELANPDLIKQLDQDKNLKNLKMYNDYFFNCYYNYLYMNNFYGQMKN